jgi:hypothetical protein
MSQLNKRNVAGEGQLIIIINQSASISMALSSVSWRYAAMAFFAIYVYYDRRGVTLVHALQHAYHALWQRSLWERADPLVLALFALVFVLVLTLHTTQSLHATQIAELQDALLNEQQQAQAAAQPNSKPAPALHHDDEKYSHAFI